MLGKGAHGRIYKATDQIENHTVAIKVVSILKQVIIESKYQ